MVLTLQVGMKKADEENYETRLKNGEAPLWEFLENLYPDGKERDAVYELICTALITNQEVYTELGMRLGANMIFELLKSNPLTETGNEKSSKKG